MRRWLLPHARAFPVALACAALPLLSAGCGKGGAAGPPGGMPAMGVEYVTLEPKPVERTTEYVGTVKSRRSTTVQPQVEGFITRIAVKSGDRVAAGATLMQIDPSRQQAAVASLQSMRAARVADLEFANQQADRQRLLLKSGAVSQQEAEQAETALRTAQAQLTAIDEQIQEAQVTLGYHQVKAPMAGVVGDIPVRVGDSATTATVLTTIDAPEGLELYVYVPVQEATGLHAGLPVRIVDDAGAVLANVTLDFVSPQVDAQTQSVLAKATLASGSGFRNEQFVRAIVIWREEPSLTVPIVAVSRVSGRYFGFVVEEADGKSVARQRALTLGPVVGNDYLLVSGLAAGDRLIVSGVQKIGDGSPVDAKPAGAVLPATADGAQPQPKS